MVTKTLLKKAFKEKTLAAIFVDLEEADYSSRNAKKAGSKHKAFLSCDRLSKYFNTVGTENIWVNTSFRMEDLYNNIYERPALTVSNFKKIYAGKNVDFVVVNPKQDEKVFLKSLHDGFQNKALGNYINKQNYKTLIIGGVSAGDKKAYGCVDHTIMGAMKHDPNLNIIVPLDSTNLEGNFETDILYMKRFIEDEKTNWLNYKNGNEHNERIHYVYTDEIMKTINEVKSELT